MEAGGTPHRTLRTVVALCGLSIAFDGYDLAVFGATVPSLLAEWRIGPAEAGTLGSYALIGMLIGALLIGTVTDWLGRRRTLIACVTWFSVLTALCAFAPSPEVFGLPRFLSGIGLGGLVIASGAGFAWNFYLFATVAVAGVLAVALVPLSPALAGERLRQAVHPEYKERTA